VKPQVFAHFWLRRICVTFRKFTTSVSGNFFNCIKELSRLQEESFDFRTGSQPNKSKFSSSHLRGDRKCDPLLCQTSLVSGLPSVQGLAFSITTDQKPSVLHLSRVYAKLFFLFLLILNLLITIDLYSSPVTPPFPHRYHVGPDKRSRGAPVEAASTKIIFT